MESIKKRHYFYLVIFIFVIYKLSPTSNNQSESAQDVSTDIEVTVAPPNEVSLSKDDALKKIELRAKTAKGESAGSLVFHEPSYYHDKKMRSWSRQYGKKWHEMAISVGVVAYTKGVCKTVNSVTVEFYSSNKNDPVIDVDCDSSSLFKNVYSEYMKDYGFISASRFEKKSLYKVESNLPSKTEFLSKCDSQVLHLAKHPDTADTDWMTDVYDADYKGKTVRAVNIRLNGKNAFGVEMHRDYQCIAGADRRYKILNN